MQRGLGGFPHERLHQDKAQLSYGKFKPLALCMADRCGTLRSHTDPCAMSDCRQNPHSRSAWLTGSMFPISVLIERSAKERNVLETRIPCRISMGSVNNQ
ncbi:MAG: hypothetical protein F6J99_41955 [Moorea sp. SIO4G3]|nr:hypothetical protein [Moorena sp. SIO4G3]